ncbi:hypothetical protein L873DRAFT_1794017 [Choiromyces venosus 120613-1]|uniref:Mediator of RNA polymerase II transcription subunit 4 n=1 Tax=Choiromyces venosus 120613-1 TaxID=1336337 RepID=A0A3N4JG93_9PEZI|nr:hypothetical protein L873DRAFT_1794017 [Choiromyces venosus 120613-1]
MNAVVQKSFDNLESSLASLIESVASYNPSPAAARAVIAADDGLAKSLDQRSYLIPRPTKQLTELLEGLSEARKELSNVPATVFEESHEVPYDELLTYARKISKYTRPPQSSKFTQADTASGGSGGDKSDQNNGGASQQSQRSLPLGLSEEDVSALDPSSQLQFTPWPSEEVMKRGALTQMGYEEELKAKGLPVPVMAPVSNGQGLGDKPGPVENARETTVSAPVQVAAAQNHRPAQQVILDLYNSDDE